MVFTKKLAMRYGMVFELVLWLVFYYCGQHGIRAVRSMRHENAVCEREIAVLQAALADDEHELARWHTFAFYKEKIAREHLQMARSNDTIFYLTHKAHEQYSDIRDVVSR